MDYKGDIFWDLICTNLDTTGLKFGVIHSSFENDWSRMIRNPIWFNSTKPMTHQFFKVKLIMYKSWSLLNCYNLRFLHEVAPHFRWYEIDMLTVDSMILAWQIGCMISKLSHQKEISNMNCLIRYQNPRFSFLKKKVTCTHFIRMKYKLTRVNSKTKIPSS